MAQFSSSSTSLILLLLVFTSVVVNACELTTRGGGCPNVNQCVETCRPCYRGVGKIHVFCRPAGAGIPFEECVCSMEEGASCNVTGPPQCPRPWPPSSSSIHDDANSIVNVNETLVIIN